MDEAASKKKFLRRILRSQRGQSLVEYVLILVIALAFTRLIYFNKTFGFKASLDKTMLTLGVYLEQNLKSGTKLGAQGENSVDGFAGTSNWSN